MTSRSWASDIEDGTMRQAERSARSPAVAGPIALMPDAHFGLGATIGSVIPTETARSSRRRWAWTSVAAWWPSRPRSMRRICRSGSTRSSTPCTGRTPFHERTRINCHHNSTERETHDGRELWITRKGAIRARVGDRGIIPGSMGTGAYIVTGLGEPSSYQSASHGAGRRFGRKEAKRRFTTDELKSRMIGRTWQSEKANDLLDESPMAYKDIDQVMRDQADLVQVDHVLHAVLNYKGTG